MARSTGVLATLAMWYVSQYASHDMICILVYFNTAPGQFFNYFFKEYDYKKSKTLHEY